MEVVDLIKKCNTDEELKELVKDVIDTYTKQSFVDNVPTDYIGTKLDINPINYHLDDPNFKIERYYDAVNIWNGYIPLGMKIVYGRFYNEQFKTSTHKGCYYYLDDDDYIFEFFKQIKDAFIEDEFDVIMEVDKFLDKKFGLSKLLCRDRDDINKLIYQKNGLFFRPTKEHSITDFYYNGSAMCSEVSVVAENLISALGLEVLFMQDKKHAYNIFAHHIEDKTDIYILDFSDWVICYDMNFNPIKTYPYFKLIEGATSKDIDEVVNEGRRIKLNDYVMYKMNNSVYEVPINKVRDYGVDFGREDEKTLILKRNNNSK